MNAVETLASSNPNGLGVRATVRKESSGTFACYLDLYNDAIGYWEQVASQNLDTEFQTLRYKVPSGQESAYIKNGDEVWARVRVTRSIGSGSTWQVSLEQIRVMVK